MVRGYRRVMQAVRAATDERDLRALKGLKLEKLKGSRKHQHSLRISGQWRLIIEFVGEGPSKKGKVVKIVDYH
jgi:toxin HigB-1